MTNKELESSKHHFFLVRKAGIKTLTFYRRIMLTTVYYK
jgi:hypothetical protein